MFSYLVHLITFDISAPRYFSRSLSPRCSHAQLFACIYIACIYFSFDCQPYSPSSLGRFPLTASYTVPCPLLHAAFLRDCCCHYSFICRLYRSSSSRFPSIYCAFLACCAVMKLYVVSPVQSHSLCIILAAHSQSSSNVYWNIREPSTLY